MLDTDWLTGWLTANTDFESILYRNGRFKVILSIDGRTVLTDSAGNPSGDTLLEALWDAYVAAYQQIKRSDAHVSD